MTTVRGGVERLVPAEPVRVDAGEVVAASSEAPPSASAPGFAGGVGLTASDLGELMTAFNEVTAKLQGSHEQLQREVGRLSTELREANERLQRSRRLAELGEMAAGIAHELRNPLGSIGLYARLLQEDLPSETEPQRTATKIARAVRRMDAIVTDVLAFAREERVRPEPVDLWALMRSACDGGVEVAGRYEPRPEVELVGLGDGVPSEVVCDPLLTHQALVNIVSNAVQAVGEAGLGGAGSVAVGARLGRELGPDGKRAEMLGLWVTDRGPGLPEGVLERMFNPFFTTREAGTGLGLAIVHRIVDAHGGRVRAVNNDDGPGATVELLLPAGLNSGDSLLELGAGARDGAACSSGEAACMEARR